MKKTIFYIAIVMFPLLFLLSACEVTEPFNGTPLPVRATIEGDTINTAPETTVTLTATAEGAETFEWMRGTTVLEETSNTLVVSTPPEGFPFAHNFTVRGVHSESGRGLVSTSHPVELIPGRLPGEVTLSGADTNVCPIPVTTLTARAPYATSFIWFLDGDSVGTSTGTFDVGEDGVWTAVGVNHLGRSAAPSNAITTTITACATIDPVNAWIGIAQLYIVAEGHPNTAPWSQEFEEGGEEDMWVTTESFRNMIWEGESIPFIIRRDRRGFYIRANEVVLANHPGFSAPVIIQLMGYNPTGGAAGTGALFTIDWDRIPLVASEDGTSFGTPADPVLFGTEPLIIGFRYTITGVGSFQTLGRLVFTLDEESQSSNSLMITDPITIEDMPRTPDVIRRCTLPTTLSTTLR